MKKFLLFLLIFLFCPVLVFAQDVYEKNAHCVSEVNDWYTGSIDNCLSKANDELSAGEINEKKYNEIIQNCNNKKLFEEYKRKTSACYEENSFGSIWNLPVLKDALVNQYADPSSLTELQKQELFSCITRVSKEHDLNQISAEAQNAIASCFEKVGNDSQTLVYKQTAIAINCAEESLGVENLDDLGNILTNMTPGQEEYLKQCVIKKTAPILTGAAILNIPFAAGVPNTLLYFQFLFTQPFILLNRKKKSWGVVFDSFTKEPVDLGIVRLIDVEKNKLIKTMVTGRKGRYLFLPIPGKYKMDVKKQGFAFPSELLKKDVYADYFGESIEIKTEEEIIDHRIPLDPDETKKSKFNFFINKWKNKLTVLIAFLAPVLSIITFVLIPVWWVFLLVLLHLAILLFFIRLGFKKKNKPFGKVVAEDGNNLSGVTVTLYDKKYGKLLHHYITDIFGRYYLPVVGGDYVLQFYKKGYKQERQEIEITEKQAEKGKLNRLIKLIKE